MLNNVIVGHVETTRHLNGTNQWRRRGAQHLVGHQSQGPLPTLCRPVQDFLDDHRAGVSINPDLHGLAFQRTGQ